MRAGGRRIIIAGVIAAVAVGITLAIGHLGTTTEEEEPSVNFPIKVDFARVVPYQNNTEVDQPTRGYVMNIRLLYPEEGPPRPFYLLLLKQGETWDSLTTAEEWVKGGDHGFEVLSSSKEFDLFTEYYPFDSRQIPAQMRLYCASCDEKWSDREIVWQRVSDRIAKIRGIAVDESETVYRVAFALGNDEIDTLPASGIVEFRLTDSFGVTLYETRFRVKDTDFLQVDDRITLLRVPKGGKTAYQWSIPTHLITPSPSGNETGFAFINFTLDEDGRTLSGGTRGVRLPVR